MTNLLEFIIGVATGVLGVGLGILLVIHPTIVDYHSCPLDEDMFCDKRFCLNCETYREWRNKNAS